LAAAWKLPVIFLCENNQWAISLIYAKATGNSVVADRAVGYGIPGVTVDGFNPFAVYGAVRDAVARARKGDGASLIEARYYRYIGHFVADDERYRDTSTNDPWREEMDPLKRIKEYLISSSTASTEEVERIYSSAIKEVDAAIKHAKKTPEPSADTLWDGLYSPEFMKKYGGD
jgi:pyruvate dehydrogenase E1 component alpha subunit